MSFTVGSHTYEGETFIDLTWNRTQHVLEIEEAEQLAKDILAMIDAVTLDNLEYSDEIKEFYKGGKELVDKLDIFKEAKE